MRNRSFTVAASWLVLAFSAVSSMTSQADNILPDSQVGLDAAFEVDDIVVSDPNESLIDPEFDKNLASLRMAWQERTGKLWVADVDPVTGTWWPQDGRQTLVDTGLVPAGLTRQGPEWAYDDQGNRAVYTKVLEGGAHLFQAWLDQTTGSYVTEPLTNGVDRSVMKGSDDPGDPRPRVTFAYSGGQTILTGWRELDDTSTETLLPSGTSTPKWVSGRRALVGTWEVEGTDQVFYYSIDTGAAIQLTFDSAQKRFPIMWWDPATQDYLLAANRDDVEIGIWARDDSQAWYLAGTIRPPSDIPYVFRPDWFTWRGASYLSYLRHTERFGQQQNFSGTGEAWVSRISGPGSFRHRQVNDPLVTRIKDVENLPLGSTVYIYYAEIIDDQNYRRLIHRAATGLF